MKTVLFIEEKPHIRENVIRLFDDISAFFKVLTARTIVEAVDIIEKIKIDAIVAEKQFRPKEMDVLDRCLARQRKIKLIVLTQETPETTKLLDTFGYTVQMPTPADPDRPFAPSPSRRR